MQGHTSTHKFGAFMVDSLHVFSIKLTPAFCLKVVLSGVASIFTSLTLGTLIGRARKQHGVDVRSLQFSLTFPPLELHLFSLL